MKDEIIFPYLANLLICFQISEFISSFQCLLVLKHTTKSIYNYLSNLSSSSFGNKSQNEAQNTIVDLKDKEISMY